MSLTRLALVIVLVLVLFGPGPAHAQVDLDALARAFWASVTDKGGSAARKAILSTEPALDFETVADALRRGRHYSADVKVGRRLLTRRNRDGVKFPYLVYVPKTYDPARPYPVRVYLHGGIMRPKRNDGSWWRNPDRFVRDDTIVVVPTSWPESIWWQPSQIENLADVLNDLKRTYHVDENRVFLLGVSDGGTGAYYHAFKASTPWAGFLPFIGNPAVLRNASLDVGGEMHVANLTNKPFFVVNSGRDRLYPVASVEPYIKLFRRAGVAIDFRPQPEGGHNLNWWPEVSDDIDAFVAATRRDPLPDRLSWRTESTQDYNRVHWLVINELDASNQAEEEPMLDPMNSVRHRVPAISLGLDTIGELEGRPGLRLMDVAADSVFGLAGVQPNDVLVSAGVRAMGSANDLRDVLIGFSPGDELPIVIERDGRRLELVAPFPDTWTEQASPAFRHQQPSGWVDVERNGNTFAVSTEGVRRFTLLLSPDRIDFSRPVRVLTNGAVSHDGVIEPNVDTMLKWAAIDQDRSMLFGAALEIDLSGGRSDQ